MIPRLQQSLERHATARSRDWWTRYLKGVIPFRGVGIPTIREVLAEWRADEQLDRLPVAEQFEVALRLLCEPVAEDKLAGILYLQQYLTTAVRWQDALPRYSELYDGGSIFDWSTCDWFCVRVLGPTIAANGVACARAVGAWRSAKNLWRARSSAVAFVNLVADTRFHDLIRKSCAVLIQREERFAKTAVGWVMRELSKHDRALVRRFVDEHEPHFSRESLNSATRFLDR